MAYPDENADIEYIRRYGDNPNAPDTTPAAVQPAPANAPAAPSPYPRLFDPTSEDASIENVNAAARATTLPGVGQPGSTDITDQTNLNVAAAMERADLASRTVQPIPSVAATAMDEFGQRRQDIEQQRTQLMAKLGMIPPSAAGLAAVVLPSTQKPRGGGQSDYEKAFEQLHYLDNESRQLLQEHHYSAIENARQAHEDLARNTHIQVSTGIAKMMNVISQANQQYGVGSPEARTAILGAYSGSDPDIAAARGTKTFEDRIKPFTDLHDVSAARLKSAVDSYKTATGREPSAIETTATGGINIRTGTEKGQVVPSKVLQDYSGLQADRAEQQSYLDQETDAKLKPPLQKKISVINAQLQSYERQFPGLATKQATAETTPTGQVETPTEVTRTTQGGRRAVFDASTKKFLRYAE